MAVSTDSGITPLPSVPSSVQQLSSELYDYLNRLRLVVQQGLNQDQSAINGMVFAINKGTSGTFNIASGGHIIITSGIVKAVSTT